MRPECLHDVQDSAPFARTARAAWPWGQGGINTSDPAHAGKPVHPLERSAQRRGRAGACAHRGGYPKFTALDLVGPHYFFACLFGAKVHLVTTEKDLSPVKSDLGLAVVPTVTMADAPKDLDVLFMPGGTEGTLAVMSRPDTIAWVQDRASRAKHVTSVCTGSMILAKAGLLKGKRATSHWAVRDVLAEYGAIPVDSRVVQDGNVLTGAGVTSGMDFAIALTEILRGRAYAEGLVLQGEYAPDPAIKGGTLATTSQPVGDMMSQMFAPLKTMFGALAKS